MKIKPKILVVDDHTANLIVIEKLLVTLDIEILRASSGNSALRIAMGNDLALILMDVQMPDMDGFETVRLLRQNKRSKFTPVIFISAVYSNNYYRVKGIESSAVDFITKPIIPEILIGKTQVFLELYKQKKELEISNEKLKKSISKQKKVEREIRKLSMAIEQGPMTVVITDIDGKIEYTNPKGTESSGYDKKDILGKTPSVLKSGKHPDSFYKNIWDTITAGEIWRGEILNKRSDGKLYWEYAVITPIKNDENEIINFMAIKEDITEKKKAEQQLRKAGEKLEQRVEQRTEALKIANKNLLFEIAQRKQAQEDIIRIKDRLATAQEIARLGSYEWDLESREITWSDEMYNLFGIEPSEICESKEKVFIKAVHEDDRDRIKKFTIRSIKEKKMESTEFRIVWKDGSVRHVHAQGKISTNNKGKAAKMIGTIHDITQSKQAENQMREAKNAAEAANRAKSEFLANMSHEIRTPMHGILSFAKFGHNEALTSERNMLQNDFKDILESGTSLMGLLNNLLDLSKLEAGKVVYEKNNDNLNHIIDIVTAEFSQVSKEKNINIEVIDEHFNPYAFFDKDKIIQVLRNIISNAIKFSISGNTIYIMANNYSIKGKRHISISIQNTGIGIPQKELSSIFDKFIQSSKTRTGAGGTGLGLSICKQIIDDHGGHIWAECDGCTTIFTFTVPRKENKKYVLIVDDSRIYRRMITTHVEEAGFDVISAKNTIDAQGKITGKDLYAIITDVYMPGMTGIDFIRNISDQLTDAKVAFVSGEEELIIPSDIALSLGEVAFMKKPIDKEVLDDFLMKIEIG